MPNKTYIALDRSTRRWWFFASLILVQFLIPPFAYKNFELSAWGDITGYVLKHALILKLDDVYWIFQSLTFISILLLFLFRNRIRMIFTLFVGFIYIMCAVFQSIATGSKYEFSIILINLLMFLMVAGVWIWEAFYQKNNFSLINITLWRIVLILLALFAFWRPETATNWNPVNIFSSNSAISFCSITPVYIAILLLFYPEINLVVLRITSSVGLIIAIYNTVLKLLLGNSNTYWSGVLHLPLLILSVIGIILSLKRINKKIKERELLQN